MGMLLHRHRALWDAEAAEKRALLQRQNEEAAAEARRIEADSGRAAKLREEQEAARAEEARKAEEERLAAEAEAKAKADAEAKAEAERLDREAEEARKRDAQDAKRGKGK